MAFLLPDRRAVVIRLDDQLNEVGGIFWSSFLDNRPMTPPIPSSVRDEDGFFPAYSSSSPLCRISCR